MAIINFNKKAVERLTGELSKVRDDFKFLKFELQGFVDAMTGEESISSFGTNNYRDYAKAVTAVSLKYENGAIWGNDLTANIIDFRAAVIVSSGPQFKPKMESSIQQKDETGKSIGKESNGINDNDMEINAAAEMDFCRSFFEINDINHETPQEWGREGEIEGRVAVELIWDEQNKQVTAKHYPWLTYKYTEIRNKDNPKIIEGISWKKDASPGIEAGEIKGDNLVCRRFSGRNSAKCPTTKVMRVLTKIENVDQAFRDWREINRLFASPVPDVECENEDQVADILAAIEGKLNWKIKKLFAHVGKFDYKSPSMTGIDSIEKEIKRQACFISGTTGYPLQFLLPDMLSNRSTSENIMESALVHTASERAIWTGFYEELIKKAMIIYSAKTSKTQLDPNKISVSISLMTEEQWQRLTSFWLPAFKDDLITREAVLPQIPDFNVSEELDRRKEADNARIAEISKELDKVKTENLNNPPPNQEQNNLPDRGKG